MTEEGPLHLPLGGVVKLRLATGTPGEVIEVDIGDPKAWRRDHPDAYQQVLADMDARIVEVVDGWGMDPPAPTIAEPLVVTVPENTPVRRIKPLPSSEDRLTMTVEEAAKALGISRAFAYEAVNNGDIPTIRIGRRILVPKAALNRLLSG